MGRYLFIAALAFIGGYVWGNATGFSNAANLYAVYGPYLPKPE